MAAEYRRYIMNSWGARGRLVDSGTEQYPSRIYPFLSGSAYLLQISRFGGFLTACVHRRGAIFLGRAPRRLPLCLALLRPRLAITSHLRLTAGNHHARDIFILLRDPPHGLDFLIGMPHSYSGLGLLRHNWPAPGTDRHSAGNRLCCAEKISTGVNAPGKPRKVAGHDPAFSGWAGRESMDAEGHLGRADRARWRLPTRAVCAGWGFTSAVRRACFPFRQCRLCLAGRPCP